MASSGGYSVPCNTGAMMTASSITALSALSAVAVLLAGLLAVLYRAGATTNTGARRFRTSAAPSRL